MRLTAAHKDHGSGSTDDQTAQPAPFDQTAQPAAAPAVSLESDPWAWRKQQLGRVAKFCGEHRNLASGKVSWFDDLPRC